MNNRLHGLVAATHTPFHADGRLNLAVVEKQAGHMLRQGVSAVFIGGTTGESHSLTVDERLALAQRWVEVARGTTLRVVVHAGSNCLADAKVVAAGAGSLGVAAVAAMPPSYFKPTSLDALVACCAEVASAAPSLPFYYYDIPTMTGVRFPMPDFLSLAAERIANLAGIKFTNADLMAYQQCLLSHDGRFDIPWGIDECLLAALALGAAGGVGSSYNFAAPVYLRMMAAFTRGDLAAARVEQARSGQLIKLLSGLGYISAAKAVMALLGIDVGPARLPHGNLGADQRARLENDLQHIGFFDWALP